MDSSAPIQIDNSGEEIIQRTLELNLSYSTAKSTLELIKFYQLEESIELIRSKGYKKVALQFPDELLIDSAFVSKYLQENSSAKTFVLGDTTFGSCCVDEVAAMHIDADFIIHYGNSCMSLTTQIPVYYVFTYKEYDIASAADKIIDFLATKNCSNIQLQLDAIYNYSSETLVKLLQEKSSVQIKDMSAKANLFFDPKDSLCENSLCKSQEMFTVDPSDSNMDSSTPILHIGTEGPKLSNMIISNSNRLIFSYNPESCECREESRNVNRHLVKRLLAIEKVRDASVLGLVVGTLSSIIERIKQLLKLSSIKFYTILVGKINVAKLANFPDIDAFVLVACPENSLVDSKEFYHPIITPFELLFALEKSFQYQLRYSSDFEQFLKLSASSKGEEGEKDSLSESEEPHFSLASGKLVASKKLSRVE
ncbi:hypothetical protein BB560_004912, partial [Smittium megazygosporum]